MSAVLDEHYQYLSDAARLDAYQRAIEETVKAGDVVLDLGSGTGILGLLACRAGARKVYALEAGGIIEAARAICRANGFEERMQFIQAHSTQAQLPEPADVAVCDQLGPFGLEAGLREYLADARRRLLKPGGRLIPNRVELQVALLESSELQGRLALWDRKPAKFDFAPLKKWAVNNPHMQTVRQEELLSEPGTMVALDLAKDAGEPLLGEARLEVRRAGRLDGLGGWFMARLSEHAELSNAPFHKSRIQRNQTCFPVEKPVEVKAGQQVQVRLRMDTRNALVSWQVELHPAPGDSNATVRHFSHSTFAGQFLSREELRKTLPGYRPKLTELGEAQLAVLEQCNGAVPIEALSRTIHDRFPSCFPSLEAAQAFVSEVLIRHAR